MITPDKIEEWLREIEDRPGSAPLIVRLVSNRLAELARRNEELLDENIQLRSGLRVEAYENRIASLEYQLDLLKRQLGPLGEAPPFPEAPLSAGVVNLLVYNPLGQILSLELKPAELESSNVIAHFSSHVVQNGEPPRLLVTSSHEELLLLFDSGKTVALPVTRIPLAQRGALDWRDAYTHQLSPVEQLVDLLPIARLPLAEYGVQVSRKGFVKNIKRAYLETFLASNYLGTGVTQKPDRPFTITLCSKDDLLVLVSQDGYLLCVEVNRLPSTIEEVMRLNPLDHLVAAFALGNKASILVVTRNGKLIHRDRGWLEPASSFRIKGQSIYSQERRAAGVKVVTAAAVDEDDCGVALSSDGALAAYEMQALLNKGALPISQPPAREAPAGHLPIEILDFTPFRAPVSKKETSQD